MTVITGGCIRLQREQADRGAIHLARKDGLSHGRNRGVAEARFEYMTYLDE